VAWSFAVRATVTIDSASLKKTELISGSFAFVKSREYFSRPIDDTRAIPHSDCVNPGGIVHESGFLGGTYVAPATVWVAISCFEISKGYDQSGLFTASVYAENTRAEDGMNDGQAFQITLVASFSVVGPLLIIVVVSVLFMRGHRKVELTGSESETESCDPSDWTPEALAHAIELAIEEYSIANPVGSSMDDPFFAFDDDELF
jgi:hypothetical protein